MAWITLTRVIRTKNPERTIPSVSEGRIRCATASTKAGRFPASRLSIVYSPVTVGGGERRGEKRPETGSQPSQTAKTSFRIRPNQKIRVVLGNATYTGLV